MFLLALPRGDRCTSRSGSQEPERLLASVEKSYRAIFDGLAGYKAEVRSIGPDDGPLCLQFAMNSDKYNYSFKKGSWSITAGYDCASELVDSVHRVAGRVIYEVPVWGSYAAVRGDIYSDRATAWNTAPAIEAVYYGHSPSLTFVSNRPLLIALALAGGVRDGVVLNRDFITEYLLYGYSMTSQTPYDGVSILESSSSLEIHNGEFELSEYPLGLQSNLKFGHSSIDAAEELKMSLQSAMKRIEEQLQGAAIQLRLSGGKDSRVLLSLLRGSSATAYGVTFGRPQDDEVLIAKYFADAAGIKLSAQSPEVAPGKTIRDKVEEVLRQCDGIPLSEPHASVYAGANPNKFGDGIMLGQWPLMKGGAAKKMRYTSEQIRSVIEAQASDIVRPECREPYDSFMLNWLDRRAASSELEKLYLFSRDFRASRWMLALTCMYSRDAKVVYPLSDSEVTAVSDSMNMGEKISESAYFWALKSLWPLATSVPTVGSAWRFEVGGINSDIDPDNYDARSMPPSAFIHNQQIVPPEGEFEERALEFTNMVVRGISREISESPFAGLFRSVVEPEFWATILGWAKGGSPDYRNLSPRVTKQLIWRVYVANVWYAKGWLRRGES